MAEQNIQCRVDGYLQYCSHPFNGNNPANTDIEPPYHVDFIIRDEPFSSPHSPDIQNFPFFVMGVAPYFNIPGLDRLVLDKLTLAKIFRGCTTSPQCLPGSITDWSDPAIKATNPPSVHAILDSAGPITVITQADADVSTKQFKQALASFDPVFLQQIGIDDTDNWNGTNHISHISAFGKMRLVS